MTRSKWKQRIGAAVIAVGGTWAGAAVIAASSSAPATTMPTGILTVGVATESSGTAATIDTGTPINDQPTQQIVTAQSHSRSGGS